MGNVAVRTALVQASMTFMRYANPASRLRVWANNIEQRRGRRKAKVALARKLATVMLAMWRKGEAYRSVAFDAYQKLQSEAHPEAVAYSRS
jgi:transposase